MRHVVFLTFAIATLATPAIAGDRFSGYYNRDCPPTHVGDLRIEPAGPPRWRVTWEPFV